MKDAGIPADSPGAAYDRAREFQRTGKYSFSAEAGWYLFRGFKAAEKIIPSLSARHWRTSFSKTGIFIGSDNPVGLDGPRGQKVGFKNAEIATFPVSRHVFLYGTNVPVKPPIVSLMDIAHANSFTMLMAEEQVYSHVPDFCWLDERGRYQTDWRLFSKDKFQ